MMVDKKSKDSGRKKILRVIIYAFSLLFVGGIISGYILWKKILAPNITAGEYEFVDIYIATGSDANDVFDTLERKGLVINPANLQWLAGKKNYHSNVHPGRYRIYDGMNNNELINLLRSGNQLPVRVTFINYRKIEELAGVVARQIEADSVSIVDLAGDTEFIGSLGFNHATIPALFIPNTYEFFWNTSAEQFFRRIKSEYERFWQGERDRKREAIGLERIEVSTLASIIVEETSRVDEMPAIAGVYINRLQRGMLLQADPTVKYSIGDFSINRVLNVHLRIDSPYNTYIYPGLPPGPIVIPSVQAIDAVLNAEEHNYLYFSAREDFSGYHRFARTLSEHNRNARLYREALNRIGVFR